MKAKLVFGIIIGLWVLPAIGEAQFLKWAGDYWRESGTINASNDFNYATHIGLSYLAGIGTMLLLGWLLTHRRTIVLWMVFGMACACVVHLIWLKPEEPIHLFPVFAPGRFSLTFFALALIGAGSFFDHALKLELPHIGE